MPRLFVAIRPPAPVCDALIDLMDWSVEGARWQDDEQLHLTLRFIGDVADRVADDIVDALGTVRSPSLDISLAGAGLFERRGRIDTLWIGAQPRERLAALHRKIDQSLIRAELAPESRRFMPHVTLARIGRRGGDVAHWIATSPTAEVARFTATGFELIESTLGATGATYDTIAHFPLDPPVRPRD